MHRPEAMTEQLIRSFMTNLCWLDARANHDLTFGRPVSFRRYQRMVTLEFDAAGQLGASITDLPFGPCGVPAAEHDLHELFDDIIARGTALRAQHQTTNQET